MYQKPERKVIRVLHITGNILVICVVSAAAVMAVELVGAKIVKSLDKKANQKQLTEMRERNDISDSVYQVYMQELRSREI